MFEENILPTHRSKFVQFVLFFACGRAPGLGHALTTKLVDVLRDDSRPKVGRHVLHSLLSHTGAVASCVVVVFTWCC